ncbi:hypothetical protein QVD17_32201 [Tagetes erecta]|uniref:Uncharacterized protein n=1 Tax=Tagetes erecta TaxID=13708 RepID=A0AAD8KBC5_TARER|nr:hypothetical protein QVD17_32201 [Tagetes erecta]
MASILKRQGLALTLITLIVISSSFRTISVAEARSPYNRVRQLATDCNSPKQGDVAGCGRGGSSKPGKPSGPAPGSSRCRKGCCGKNKFGECICCK